MLPQSIGVVVQKKIEDWAMLAVMDLIFIEDKKVEAIKVIRDHVGCSLMEAKNFIDAIYIKVEDAGRWSRNSEPFKKNFEDKGIS